LAYRLDGQAVSAAAFYATACHPQRTVVVEACAGSGKTWMLVARIVRALLDGTAPHEVLAITFTNKAAAEMRTRLDDALLALATCSEAQRVATLVGFGFSEADAQAQSAAAAGLMDQVLAQPRQVEVRTFHGWFAQLVKSAPIDALHSLGLPVGATLVEDDAPAMAATWRRLLQRVVADAALKADYTALVRQVGRSTAQAALEAVWHRRVEFAQADAAGVVHTAVQPFTAMPGMGGLADPLDALPAQRDAWLGWARQLGAVRSGTTGPKTAQAIQQAWAAFDAAQTNRAQLLGALAKAVLTAEGEGQKNVVKLPGGRECVDAVQPVLAAQAQHEAWLFHQRSTRLARAWLAEYAAFKRERGLVDMGDLEVAAVHLLGDDATQAFMAERLDARIRHVLIDEFQDTNPLQWQALQGWLSGYAGAGGGRPLSVFLVGDPKQSIYAFRRADPAVFAAATAFVQQAFGAAHLACDHTRRCAPAVVQAVNTVFGHAQAQGEFAGFRPHTTERSAPPGSAPAVWCLPLVPKPGKANGGAADDEADTAAGPWRDSLSQPQREPEQRSLQVESTQAAQQVAAWLAQGLRPGEVLVLARKHDPLAAMAAALKALGIASQLREKALLADALEVRDVLALLDALVSPQHNLALAQALRSPLFGATDADLMALATAVRQAPVQASGRPSWWALLMQGSWPQHPALARAAATLPQWAAWVNALPPHDALDAIYAQGDVLARYAAAVPAAQRGSVVGNLRQLLHEALQLDGGRYATAYGLVRALRGVNASAANGRTRVDPAPVVGTAPVDDPAAAADQVQLLTVHSAKGLQARAVLLLDTLPSTRSESKPMALMDWPPNAPAPRRFAVVRSQGRVPPELADTWAAQQAVAARENLNVLYVAMTRAQDQLVFSARQPGKGEDAGAPWHRAQAAGVALLPQPHVPSVALAPPGQAAPGAGGATPTLAWPELLPWQPAVEGSAASEAAPPDADTRATQMGMALHRVMEWATSSGAPWGRAGAAWLAQAAQAFELTPGEAQVVGQAAQAMLANPTAAPLLQPAAQAHNEVALTWGGATLRLDRLVKSATGPWWVLDYKLGTQVRGVPAYEQQMTQYLAAVRAALPSQPVRGAWLNGQGDWLEFEG
jgi:ATP-dependent helicase/nuclease subunit A